MARALEVARDGEEKAATKMREEHRKAMVSATEGYAVRLRSVEVQYAADLTSAKDHFTKESEAMRKRHERHVERLQQKFSEDKQRAIDDCIQCSQSELDMALQAATKDREDAILRINHEHQRNISHLRLELEREKENAVEACLQSTLEEMSTALETAHKQRREDVRAVRDEWKRQMKDTVDKQAQSHTKQIEELRKTMEEAAETKLRSAENEVRAQMQVELRRAVAKIQRELDDASSKTTELKNALTHAESRCAAAEDALKKSRQQRQRNFDEMNQLYTAQAAEEAAAAAAEVERQKSRRSSGGGFFSRMFGGGGSRTNTPQSKNSSSPMSEDYLVVDSNGDSTTVHTPGVEEHRPRSKNNRVYNANRSPHSRSSSSPDSTLGTRYATLIESYSAMMGQVELLGDQLLEERTRVSQLEDEVAKRIEREADLKARIESYRSRLDEDMHAQSSASNNTSSVHSGQGSEQTGGSLWGLGSTSRNRRDVLQIDALEGHVTRLQELLSKSDLEQDNLRSQLAVKAKELRHQEIIHEQSLKKLMEMQRREIERGKAQIELDKSGVRRTNNGMNVWFSTEGGRRSRSNSSMSLGSSNSGDGSFSVHSREGLSTSSLSERPRTNPHLRVPLRGGGGRSKRSTSPRVSPKSRTIIGIDHDDTKSKHALEKKVSGSQLGLSVSDSAVELSEAVVEGDAGKMDSVRQESLSSTGDSTPASEWL
eukprot:g3810.t1